MTDYKQIARDIIRDAVFSMDDFNVVQIAREIDTWDGSFDNVFITYSINDLIDAGFDTDTVVRAVFESGATDFNDVVRETPYNGFELVTADDLVWDARHFYDTDIVDWLIENNYHINDLYWPDFRVRDVVIAAIDSYYANVCGTLASIECALA